MAGVVKGRLTLYIHGPNVGPLRQQQLRDLHSPLLVVTMHRAVESRVEFCAPVMDVRAHLDQSVNEVDGTIRAGLHKWGAHGWGVDPVGTDVDARPMRRQPPHHIPV